MKKAVTLIIFCAMLFSMAACTNRTGNQNTTSPTPSGAATVTTAPTIAATEAPTPAATTAPTEPAGNDVSPTGTNTATNP